MSLLPTYSTSRKSQEAESVATTAKVIIFEYIVFIIALSSE